MTKTATKKIRRTSEEIVGDLETEIAAVSTREDPWPHARRVYSEVHEFLGVVRHVSKRHDALDELREVKVLPATAGRTCSRSPSRPCRTTTPTTKDAL